jgi:hypothetical protein
MELVHLDSKTQDDHLAVLSRALSIEDVMKREKIKAKGNTLSIRGESPFVLTLKRAILIECSLLDLVLESFKVHL